jgi:hypothetical protein
LYEGGNTIDLNTLLPTGSSWGLQAAYGVNDSGQTVGYGYINGGEYEYRAFLMTPVREPATLLLLALGAVMLRRKCRA